MAIRFEITKIETQGSPLYEAKAINENDEIVLEWQVDLYYVEILFLDGFHGVCIAFNFLPAGSIVQESPRKNRGVHGIVAFFARVSAAARRTLSPPKSHLFRHGRRHHFSIDRAIGILGRVRPKRLRRTFHVAAYTARSFVDFLQRHVVMIRQDSFGDGRVDFAMVCLGQQFSQTNHARARRRGGFGAMGIVGFFGQYVATDGAIGRIKDTILFPLHVACAETQFQQHDFSCVDVAKKPRAWVIPRVRMGHGLYVLVERRGVLHGLSDSAKIGMLGEIGRIGGVGDRALAPHDSCTGDEPIDAAAQETRQRLHTEGMTVGGRHVLDNVTKGCKRVGEMGIVGHHDIAVLGRRTSGNEGAATFSPFGRFVFGRRESAIDTEKTVPFHQEFQCNAYAMMVGAGHHTT